WDVWEVNAGWVFWLDGAVVLMTRVTGIRLHPGACRPGGWKGFESCALRDENRNSDKQPAFK
ncbi:MAG: hypothetical protein ABWY82_14175, partial [Tardiphaga sp.]